jgi:hypothetical protein
MIGPRHRLGAAEVNQPAEALLGALRHQGLHPVPELLLASCDEYGRICNSERDRRGIIPKNCRLSAW